MLSAISRSGEEFSVLSEFGLTQARSPRLSEMSWSCVVFCLYFSPGEIGMDVWANVWLA